MDIVLGVSMAPRTVRLVAIEGQDADGVTVEQEEFEVSTAGDRAADAIDRVIDAISGTREGVFEGGHRLSSTGVTWTNPADVAALREAINANDLGDVMLVAPLLAAAALAQTVGYALAYEHIAMLFAESGSATLAVVDVSDGSIVDLHRRRITAGPGEAVAAELATMVAGLDASGSQADGVFLVGCGIDIVSLKPTIEAATSLRVTGPEEPDMALARGAALASANAPLFASSTAALAYALDPGTGELGPPALNPTYVDAWGEAGAGTGVLAYSALPDAAEVDDEKAPRRSSRAMLLTGSALAGIAAAIAGVVLVTLTSDQPARDGGHNSGVSVATPAAQLPAPPPSNPPQAQLPAPSTSAPAPAPSTEVAAPAPAPTPSQAPSQVAQPAPQPTVTSAPPAPVRRSPTRPAPQYVPQPVEQAAPPPAAAPAPPPAAPPPAPAPAAPPPPQQPPVTMYLHFPFVTVPIPITPPAPPPGP